MSFSQSWNSAFSAATSPATKAQILVAVERAIDVVGAGAARAGLVVARLEPGDVHVDRLAIDDRRDGVEEGEARPRPVAAWIDAASEAEVRGPVATIAGPQSAGGSSVTSPGSMRISGCARSAAVTACGKAVAVDRERAAGRELVAVAHRA